MTSEKDPNAEPNELQTLNDPAKTDLSVSDEPAAAEDFPAPPDGGLMAWSQVFCSFLIFFNVLGLLNTYGQFQTIYETDILKSNTPSTIAWIGSAQFFICYVVCMFTGPVWDAGHAHLLMGSGTVIMVIGIMMISLCHEYYQFFLAQALVTGMGFGLVFMPASAIVPQWFSSKAALGVGIATCGSSFGAVIYPVMFKLLVPEIGFPWTVRIIGFIVLATMIVACAIMRLRAPPSKTKRKIVDFNHLRDIKYLLSCIGFFIGFLGIYVFYFYIQLYAIQTAGTNTGLAFYLLAILNAGSFFGRLVPNYVAGIIGPLNVQIIFGFLSGVLAFCLLAIKTTPGIVAFTALYGFISGPFVSLPIPVITSVSPDKSVWGTRLGMSFAMIGLAVLIGEPAAGAILGTHENWPGLIVWCGVMLVASSAILISVRVLKVGVGLKGKA
ncbi:hypothetical protein G7Y89_g15582 [Cudoniella acicularis]|uniref:Major facilitator superfamily (MFS) profile domain-containing protein n=1 Tax=Cudoniella acicularis TaxID=354080 RepID=A0A8H4VJY2_9HELO|nr:hypothetical protein G7Y89_g15582 [Cudoniella acicularis]